MSDPVNNPVNSAVNSAVNNTVESEGDVLIQRDWERELEAILMIADQPQSVVELSAALGAPVQELKDAIAALVADYDGSTGGPERGFELREVGGGWRIYVRPRYDEVVARVIHEQTPAKLSSAALETLAVIAYKQPVSRAQVSAIRAVNVDSVVRTLQGRGLIRESHTDQETGAIFYVTTDLLLQELGVESLEELPPLSPLLDDGAEGFSDVE